MISQSEISQIGSADLEGSGLYFDAKFWSRPSILDQTAIHIYIYIWNQLTKLNIVRRAGFSLQGLGVVGFGLVGFG